MWGPKCLKGDANRLCNKDSDLFRKSGKRGGGMRVKSSGGGIVSDCVLRVRGGRKLSAGTREGRTHSGNTTYYKGGMP